MILQLESKTGKTGRTVWELAVVPQSQAEIDRGMPTDAQVGMTLLEIAAGFLGQAGNVGVFETPGPSREPSTIALPPGLVKP